MCFYFNKTGGTNDMVVHQVKPDDKIKEVCAVNGGAAGGNQVNDKFVGLLNDIFGSEFITEYQRRNSNQWLTLMLKFGNGKKKVHRDKKGKIRVELPFGMDKDFEDITGRPFTEISIKAKEKGTLFVKSALVLSNDLVRNLFKETISNVVEGVRSVLCDPKCKDIHYIFMVGGFSENEYLQSAIKDKFEQPHCKVLIPNEAQLAIIKGAVIYGHRQN